MSIRKDLMKDGRVKLIIVEDSPLLMRLLTDELTEARYSEIVTFENGKEAYDYVVELTDNGENLSDHIDMIISDIEMPKMDGHRLTKLLKDNPQSSDVPIMIFSSLITDDLRHRGEVVGADEQISKPEISELIKKWIRT